jgi:hypothetical protein
MKTPYKLAAGICLLGALALTSFTEYVSLEIGKPVPKAATKVTDVSGKVITLTDSKGKNGLLVIFSCNTCPFVVKNEGRIKEVTAYAMKNEIGVVVVNSNEGQRDGDDSFDAMKKYKADKQFSGFYVLDKDDELANAFGATHTPESFLFGKSGMLLYKGAIDDSPRDETAVKTHFLKDAIDAAAKGQELKTNTVTKSVGCTIKRKEA